MDSKPKFVHLHSHTEYSLLDGMSKIKKLVKKTKELGMDALAITDHGAMYGAIEFYKTCRENEVKPIIGCEFYIAPRSHKSKEGRADTEPFHLTIVAKNYQGYLNLMKLVSIAHIDGFYYKPRIDKQLLKEYHEGLICLSGCPAGEFIRGLEKGGIEEAEKIARMYLEIFGEGNYFFELQNHHYEDLLKKPISIEEVKKDLEQMNRIQKMTWQAVQQLSPKLGIPIVATNDFHYINESDAEAQDALVCVATGKYIKDINRLRMIDTPNLYLKSPEEMLEGFKEIPQALETSVKIAEMVDVEIPLGKAYFPIFDTPQGKTAEEYLRELTYEKAKEKLELTEEIKQRLEYELDVIIFKNYSDYFLVVADFISWAHEQGIITNTRGSAAGSLVLYCLGVTNLNPLDYKLPFERFLNKSRPTMPDIDADLADDRRDDVIHYCMDKYGHDKVAHIVTFGTMMGRAAIRDVGRVLAMPYADVDKIAKLVPPPKQGFHTSLSDHLLQVAELKEIYISNPEYKKLIDLAVQIEGTVRHASVHAAGILITPEEITKFAPIQKESNGDKIVAQYDMHAVVDEYGGIGLVKMDFLGLRNLSILGKGVDYVMKNKGIEVDLNKLPLDDIKTYELLARGETMGVFQLSSEGMTKYLMDLKPTNIFDIMAMVALYRPGPLSIIPEYISRKHDPSKVTYLDSRMEEYMSTSLGLLVYQEDVIMTAINIAQYTWEEADKFRKAMGKKKPEEMAKQREKFVKGASTNGMTKEKAEELFKLIETFAAYGFNKSHAASYAMVSYQTAYMKANFPVEYMAAIMTAEYGDIDKIALAIEECKKMKIMVLPPDVNFSVEGFKIEDLKDLPEDEINRQITDVDMAQAIQGIRFGLSAIKNVGLSAIESIIKARQERPFESLADLCSRIDLRIANRKTLEALIKAGAMDRFGSRAAQLAVLERCLEESHKHNKMYASGQVSLFGEDEPEVSSVSIDLPDIEEMPLEQLLTFEKELLGFYLHEPPYLKRIKNLTEFVNMTVSKFSEENVGKKYTIGGLIVEMKKVITKKSAQEMAFLRIFDGTGEVDCVIFPTTFAENKDILQKEEVVIINGKLDQREDKFSIVVDSIEQFDPNIAARMVTTSVEIEFKNRPDGEVLKQLNQALRQYPGTTPISVLIPAGDTFKKMPLSFGIDPSGDLFNNVEQLLGSGSIRLT